MKTLSTREAASVAGCSPQAIRKAIASGELPGRKLGGRRGYVTTQAAVRAWVHGGQAIQHRDPTEGEGREAWLEERRKGVGGSEIGVLLGVSRFATELDLYLEKTGSHLVAETEAMRAGRALEPIVVDRLVERDGHAIEKPGLLVSPSQPIHRATPDGVTLSAVRKGVEIKTTDSLGFARAWGEPGDTGGIPLSAWAQLQWAMPLLDVEDGTVEVLVVGQSWDLHSYPCPRDRAFFKETLALAVAWWHDHVEARVPPLPVDSDVDEWARVSDRIGDAFEQGRDVVEVAPEIERLADVYDRARRVAAYADKFKTAASARLKARLGERGIVRADLKAWRVTAKDTHPKPRTDWQALAAALWQQALDRAGVGEPTSPGREEWDRQWADLVAAHSNTPKPQRRLDVRRPKGWTR